MTQPAPTRAAPARAGAATDPLARARTIARVLDAAVKVPGTGVRFGADAVLGLIPGLGDVAGAALAGYLVLLAQRLGAPRTVIMRMIANVAVDTFGGTIPLVGDLFDVAYKSNMRNVALLERALGGTAGGDTPSPAGPRASRWIMVAAFLGLTLLAAGALVVTVLAVRAIAAFVNGR